uniref:Uncharacterized protein n=1 Tax=Attheya septentrionalis TaxID=420275 RepID=A0A7S2XP49_9STRA|mmetsp:Transcript_24417/g.44167  ORF Transcript_24417/g.44167 Transcript_24417/m.44167 type:complete len:290 (+) Transcript_24417:404-1273(+)
MLNTDVWVVMGQAAWVASIVFSSTAVEPFVKRISAADPVVALPAGPVCEDYHRIQRWCMKRILKVQCIHRLQRESLPVPRWTVFLTIAIWTCLICMATIWFFQQSHRFTVSLGCNLAAFALLSYLKVGTCQFTDELACASIVGALGLAAWLIMAIEIPSRANIEIPKNETFAAAVDAPPPVSSFTGLANHDETLPRRSDELSKSNRLRALERFQYGSREHRFPHAADSYMMDRFFYLDEREIRLREMALASSYRVSAIHDTKERCEIFHDTKERCELSESMYQRTASVC